MSRFQTRREGYLRDLRTLGPMIGATLCVRKNKCGNPNCKCARGEKHESWCLTFKDKGRTKTVHVPREMLPEVQEWVKEHKRAKALLAKISYQSMRILKEYVPQKRAAARAKERG